MGYAGGFRIGVADGDRIIVRPSDAVVVPFPGGSGDDTDVWTMTEPPPAVPPPGMEPGDTWIDVTSGNVYVLTPEQHHKEAAIPSAATPEMA